MSKEKDSNSKLYVRLSSVAIQMAAVIGGFTFLGNFLDKKQENGTPVWTICLSLFGVFAAMYLIFKELKNINSKKDD